MKLEIRMVHMFFTYLNQDRVNRSVGCLELIFQGYCILENQKDQY